MKTETEMLEIFKKNIEAEQFVCRGMSCRHCPFWSIIEGRGNCGGF